MQPTVEGSGTDSEMKSQDSLDEKNCIDLERYRNLVRTFIDLVMFILIIKFIYMINIQNKFKLKFLCLVKYE